MHQLYVSNNKSYSILAFAISILTMTSTTAQETTITGRVVSSMAGLDSLSAPYLGIWDIEVNLSLLDIKSDSTRTFTDSSGYFNFTVDRNGENSLGRFVISVVAKNSARTIKITHGLGNVATEGNLIYNMTNDELANDTLLIIIPHSNFKAQYLHWANVARSFVDRYLASDSIFEYGILNASDLVIVNSPTKATFFLPKGASLNPFNFLTKERLQINKQYWDDPYTIFHEFGHYTMWHLQNQGWSSWTRAGLAVHYAQYNNNNTMISWTEGFANGIEKIVGAYYETHFVDTTGSTYNVIINDIDSLVDIWSPSYDGFNCNMPTSGAHTRVQGITHGILSEELIGQVIYDLWDGPNQPIGNTTFDDNGNDQLELSFKEVMQPVLNNQLNKVPVSAFQFFNPFYFLLRMTKQGQLITDVTEYHGGFRSIFKDDLKTLGSIHHLFNYNKIKNLSDFLGTDQTEPNTFPRRADFLNLDDIKIHVSRTTQLETFRGEIFAPRVSLGDSTIELNNCNRDLRVVASLDIISLPDSNSHFNYFPHNRADSILCDTMAIENHAHLYFNADTIYGWQKETNYFEEPTISFSAFEDVVDIDLDCRMGLHVLDNGRIVVGNEPDEDGNSKAANIHIRSGSTMYIGGNSSSNIGTLEIHQGSRVIIEQGGRLVFNPGGQIILHGNGSGNPLRNGVLEIVGNLEIRNNATFDFDGAGYIESRIPSAWELPNVVLEPAAHINIVGEQMGEHMMMRVMPGTFFKPNRNNCAQSFGLKNGNVEIGNDAHVDFGGLQTEVNEVIVQPIDQDTRANGLITRGQNVRITNNRIMDQQIGIRSFYYAGSSSCGSNPISISQNNFQGNQDAIVLEDIHYEIVENEFSGSSNAISSLGHLGRSLIASNRIHGNANGITLETKKFDREAFLDGSYVQNEVAFFGNRIYSNRNYAVQASNTFLTMQCDSISGNQEAVILSNSFLDVSDNSYVDFRDNEHILILKKTYMPLVAYGQNNFGPLVDEEKIFGSVFETSCQPFDLNYNNIQKLYPKTIEIIDTEYRCGVPVLFDHPSQPSNEDQCKELKK